ncbi:low-affinity inorganic phosphate transporter 1 [bacterium BMS3Abin05]|nr:low-affinity inorganic phosphate transporter 1 [bacterium BMS3Abin05]GBE27451.1 low-affinity inorganic phosphate transporter 1 [bacterium BMS3Bbin03]
MAMNIGGNDVANAMGTSVGSKALTFKQAVIVAAIFEFAGSVLVGSHVTNTIRKGIVNPLHFASSPEILLLGMLAALFSAALFLQLATALGLPVSTTHSIVGAVIGFSLIAKGFSSVDWTKFIQIFLSWIISPLAGASIAFLTFTLVRIKILDKVHPEKEAKKYAPFLIFLVFAILFLSFVYKGLKNLHLDLPFSTALGYSVIAAAILAVISSFFFRRMRANGRNQADFVENIFKYLQIVTACYVAFAHGANDVANAIGPLAAIISILSTHSVVMKVSVPFWILAFGGAGIVIGLILFGMNVIKTVGEKITEITPSRGFSAEFGAATTVLVFSRLGLPISTTHTLVGAVIGVGLARGIGSLNMLVIRDIVASWFITLPATAVLSMGIFEILRVLF